MLARNHVQTCPQTVPFLPATGPCSKKEKKHQRHNLLFLCCAGATFWSNEMFSATAAKGVVARSATHDFGRATCWAQKLVVCVCFFKHYFSNSLLNLAKKKMGPLRRSTIGVHS